MVDVGEVSETNLKVTFEGFIMKVLYYKGLIIKKAYTFKYCRNYRWHITGINNLFFI